MNCQKYITVLGSREGIDLCSPKMYRSCVISGFLDQRVYLTWVLHVLRIWARGGHTLDECVGLACAYINVCSIVAIVYATFYTDKTRISTTSTWPLYSQQFLHEYIHALWLQYRRKSDISKPGGGRIRAVSQANQFGCFFVVSALFVLTRRKWCVEKCDWDVTGGWPWNTL